MINFFIEYLYTLIYVVALSYVISLTYPYIRKENMLRNIMVILSYTFVLNIVTYTSPHNGWLYVIGNLMCISLDFIYCGVLVKRFRLNNLFITTIYYSIQIIVGSVMIAVALEIFDNTYLDIVWGSMRVVFPLGNYISSALICKYAVQKRDFVDLPEVPEGSKIEIVAVNPEGIIGLDGKVTTPENDTDVIVTIQVTDTNRATAKADVKVLVRGEKADPDPNPNPDPDPDDDNNGNDNNSGNNNNGGSNNGGNNNTGNNGGSSNSGSHNNGSTSGSHSQSVQTGDNANVIMWAVLLVAAVAAVGAVVIIRRKKK